MKESPCSERDLVERAQIEPQAFADLYDRYFPQIYNYVRYRVELITDAEDLTSSIFERVFTKLESYQIERDSFTSWLFTIAHNTVTDYYRNRKQWQGLLNKVKDAPVVTGCRSPESVCISNENRHELLRAISCLSVREQDLIALKFSTGLTNRSIAKITGLSESNVAVILYRAMLRLRSKLTVGGESLHV